MFTTIIVQPIFNLLVLIYALLPGHNFGLSIIIFTILIRLLMWPLIKKQLHQAKAMRKLQPELKRIKAATKGDKQKESAMLMELYKERGVNPFSSLGVVLLQLPILIGLYSGLRRIITNPEAIINFSYPALHNLSWMKQLKGNIHLFDHTLFGAVDLTRTALNKTGGIYWGAMLLVLGSALAQYYQSKQLLPTDKDSRGLRQLLKDAGSGKQADQSEVNAAVGRSSRYFIPVMIFFIALGIASALSLYWFVGGVVAYLQQAYILKKDEEELEVLADKPAAKQVIEGEVVSKGAPVKRRQGSKVKKNKNKGRRR